MRKRFLVGSGAPDWVPVRLIRLVVALQPLGTMPVATEFTKAEVAVEANLSTAVFAEDSGEGNRVLTEVCLIFL